MLRNLFLCIVFWNMASYAQGATLRDTLRTLQGTTTSVLITGPAGVVLETYQLKNGRKHGPHEWFSNSKPIRRETYTNGHLHGEFLLFDTRSQPVLKANYAYRPRQGRSVLSGNYTTYVNHKIRVQATYKDSLQHGQYREFAPEGHLLIQSNFKAGVLIGKYEQFYPKGQIRLRQRYVQQMESGKNVAVLHGRYEAFGPQGVKVTSGAYAHGKKEGVWQEFHANGQLRSRQSYSDGRRHGLQTHWFDDGKMELQFTFYEAISVDGVSYKSVHDGLFEQYFKNGNLQKRAFYKWGKYHGPYVVHSENGSLREQKTFVEGFETGKSQTFDANGLLRLQTNYAIDSLSGQSQKHGEELWFENGLLSERILYQNGVVHGTAEMFYPSGRIKQTREFKNGLLNGAYVTYYESGQIESKREYTVRLQPDGKPKSENTGAVYQYATNGDINAFYLIDNAGQNMVEAKYEQGSLVYYQMQGLFSLMYAPQQSPIAMLIHGTNNLPLAGYYFYRNGHLRKLAYQDPSDGVPRHAEFSDEGEWLSVYAQNHAEEHQASPDYARAVAKKVNPEWRRAPFLTDSYKQGHYALTFADGTPFLQASFSDNVVHGKFLVYEPTRGDTLVYRNFDRGLAHGDYVIKFPGDKTAQRGSYHKNGKPAKVYHFHPNGKTASIKVFDSIGRQTRTEEFHENGRLSKQTDSIGRTILAIDLNGLVQSEWVAIPEKPGWRISREYHPHTRQLKSETFFLNQQRDSIQSHFFVNGNVRYKVHYRNNMRHGHYTEFSENGSLLKIGRYEHDKMSGEWVDYKTGTPQSSYYEQGKLVVAPPVEKCGCIDDSLSNSAIGFAPTLKTVLPYHKVQNALPPFILPVEGFNYDSVFATNYQFSNGHSGGFTSLKMLMFDDFSFYVPADKQVKIILNPCRTLGYLSNMQVSASYGFNHPEDYRLTLYPKRIALQLPNSPLVSKNQKSFEALFNVDYIQANGGAPLRIVTAKDPKACFSDAVIKGVLDVQVTSADIFLFDDSRAPSLATPELRPVERDRFFGLVVTAAEMLLDISQGAVRERIPARSTHLLAGGNFVSGEMQIICRLEDGLYQGEAFSFSGEALEKFLLQHGFSRLSQVYDASVGVLTLTFFVQ